MALKSAGFSLRIMPAALLGLLVCSASAQAIDLSTVIIDSISSSPTVKEKIHSYQRSLRDSDIAHSGWRPSIDLQASTGLYNTESPSTGNDSVDYDSTNVELSLTQNLFNGYDTTHQIEQTKARISAALYEIYDSADNVALEAAQAYLEVLKQRRLYQLAGENVAAHEDILAQIRQRNLSGVGRRSQLQQTEGRVARAHASLIAQQNNLEDAATQLHKLLGRYVNPESLIEPELPSLPDRDLDTLIDEALSAHPAMRVAGFNIEAALSDHRRSLRTGYPNIDLRLATEYGNDIGGVDGDTEETSIVLNLTYNFYNGNRDKAEQRQKISTVYEQKEFAANVRRQIINTLRLAWVADDALNRQLEFLELHITKASQTVESYKEEFFIGQRDLIDLLDAENERNSAQNQYTQAKYDAFGARYRVYESFGNLFPVTYVSFEIEDDRLRVARLDSNRDHDLPLPEDEDQDEEIDQSDHCDNSLLNAEVNPYGCAETLNIVAIEPVAVAVNAKPVAVDDRFELEADGVLLITHQQLLANDYDEDGDSLEVVDVSQPEFGQLGFNQAENLVYRPAEGYIGSDSFSYTIADNSGDSATATATVEIRVRTATINLNKMQLVNFVYDEAELTENSQTKVEAIIEQIKKVGEVSIEVYTYTDNIGSDGYNLRLSRKRAEAMRDLLISNGIDPSRIIAIGMGENNPIADNSTEAGQAINRRGEFIIRVESETQ